MHGAPVAEGSRISEAERIAAQLRAAIRMTPVARGRARAGSAEPGSMEADALEADLMTLRSNCEIAHAPFRSHRRFAGRFIICIRNLVREIIAQPLERQDSYNRAGLRALERLTRKLDAIAREQD